MYILFQIDESYFGIGIDARMGIWHLTGDIAAFDKKKIIIGPRALKFGILM